MDVEHSADDDAGNMFIVPGPWALHCDRVLEAPGVRETGWKVFMSGGYAWCKWTVMPMAVTLVVMHSVVQVCTVSVMHGHRTGRSQIFCKCVRNAFHGGFGCGSTCNYHDVVPEL